jgi:hypothetical protein
MPPADSNNEAAAGDQLAAYLATIPRGLGANAWGRWRKQHPPPYLRWENRRHGVCGLCGGPLSAWLQLCHACARREFDHCRNLAAQARPALPGPGRDGRRVRVETLVYPQQGHWRPACEQTFYVVEDETGLEVARSLDRETAERFLDQRPPEAAPSSAIGTEDAGWPCRRHTREVPTAWCQDCRCGLGLDP